METPLFSIAAIVRNEEKTLSKLLLSLEEFKQRGGEVVILDTGSTDNTVKIAQDWGCKVECVGEKYLHTIDEDLAKKINDKFIIENEGDIVKAGEKYFDFSSARNHAASLAKNDYVSFADADEMITKMNIEHINTLIKAGKDQFEYFFVFSHDQWGNEAIKFIQSKFYNRTKIHWVGLVHEMLQSKGGPINICALSEDLFKLEHWQNFETTRHSYLVGLAVDCYNNPEKDRNSHYFARELLWQGGKVKSAIKEFERHISMNRWLQEKCQSMIFIGDAYGMLNMPEEQVKWYNRSFHEDPSRRVSLIKLARFYQHNNKYLHAACYAKAALEIPWDAFYANLMSEYTFEPHEILYWAYGWLGRIKDAQEQIKKCLEYQPLNSTYLRDLKYYFDLPKVSFVIPQLGRSEGLQKCIESIYRLNYPQDKIEIITEEGDETVPVKVKNGVSKATGSYIVYAANDTEFTPDSLILAVWESMQSGKGLVAFDTGVRNSEGYINEHFLFRLDLLPLIGGEVFDTEFHHVGVDDLLWKKCKKLDQAMISKGQVIHKHFSRIGSGIEKDEVIQKGWSKENEDRELLAKKIKDLGL